MRILIAFHSDYGNTEKMACAITAGIKAVQATAKISLKKAADTLPEDLREADVIIFGTPVHMGAMAWQMKKLVDDCAKLWMENALEGKVGGVFATGGGFGGAGGGVELTMASLHSNFLEHGMIVVGFPKDANGYADGGLQWGPYARTGNHQGMPEGILGPSLAAARAYGSHICEIAQKLVT